MAKLLLAGAMIGQCLIPDLTNGMTYNQVSAGGGHTVLLRSDGQAVACGCNDHGQCLIPDLIHGMTYTQVSAGTDHTVLLRSDGQVVACGSNEYGQCLLPDLIHGMTYNQVSAGREHTVLLRSDGQAVACGCNDSGQCLIPDLTNGMTYNQVSAGGGHTLLLRSDGQAVACGCNDHGQCLIPDLIHGMTYNQVSAGGDHTVLLRSDGHAVASGCRLSWRSMPPLEPSHHYVCSMQEHILQLLAYEHDANEAVILMGLALDGHEVVRLNVQKSDSAAYICKRVEHEWHTLQTQVLSRGKVLKMVLPDGNLFASTCQANPSAKLSDVIQVVAD